MTINLNESEVQCVPNQGWDARIRVFQYGRLVTSFALISARYVVLLDTLINAETATALLDHVRDALDDGRQLLVINSHADWDHAWGNQIFAGPDAQHPAPIIAHRLCRERLLSDEAQSTLNQKQQQEPELYSNVRLQPPTITFDEHLSIDGGDLTINLLPTPGHTPDHLAVFVPEIHALFAGDAAEWPIPFVGSADTLPQLRASLAKMLALAPTTAFYCHAPGMYDADVLRANIAYFDELERRASAALAGGSGSINHDTVSDPEAFVGYRFEEVPGVDALNSEEQAFYRGAHRTAIKAMLEHLQGHANNGLAERINA